MVVLAPRQPRTLTNAVGWVNFPEREWGVYEAFQAATHARAGYQSSDVYAIYVGPAARPAWLLSNVCGGATLIFGGRVAAATAVTPMRQLTIRPADLAEPSFPTQLAAASSIRATPPILHVYGSRPIATQLTIFLLPCREAGQRSESLSAASTLSAIVPR